MRDRHNKKKTEENNRNPGWPWVLAVWQALRPVGNGMRNGVSYELTWDYSRRLPQSRPTVRRKSTSDPHYEKNVTTSQVTRYYYTGAHRIAMNQGGVVYRLLTNHLGSTALTFNSSGSKVGELRYAQHPGAQRSG